MISETWYNSMMFSCSFFIERVRRYWRVSERVYLVVVSFNEINGFCSKLSDGEYVIVLSEGLFGHVLGLSRAIVNCESIASLLELDMQPRVTADNYVHFSRDDGYPALDGFKSDVEFQSSRAMAAGILCCVTMHEMGHIQNGHLELLLARTVDNDISGLFYSQPDRLSTMSALEYDADCFVALAMLAALPVFKQLPSCMLPMSSSMEVYVKWIAVANAALFIDQGVQQAVSLDRGSDYHPSRRFRLYLAFGMIAEVLLQRGLADQEHTKRVLAESVPAVFQASRFLSLADLEAPFSYEDFVFNYKHQSDAMLGRWARLHPIFSQLTLCKTGKLAPPSMPPV